ncbi:hypothetical protein ABZ865_19270 [Streptomyces sp. NPDC047085]|uniref:hypothetical protein n=1 Tax=Streptomyces sp. NPDC047085 TaxID=3155140 RepID=UPI0033C008DD
MPSDLALGDVPDEETVAAGASPAFLAEVEKTADELVRAAEALCLHGPAYQVPMTGRSTRSWQVVSSST